MAKPKCKLSGTGGNVFIVINNVGGTLKKAGFKDKAKEFVDKAYKSKDYDAVLQLAHKYVDIE